MFEDQIIKSINRDIEYIGFASCDYADIVRCLARDNNLAWWIGKDTHPLVVNIDVMSDSHNKNITSVIKQAKDKFRELSIEQNWAIDQTDWGVECGHVVSQGNHYPIRIFNDEYRIKSKRKISGYTAHQAVLRGMMEIREYVELLHPIDDLGVLRVNPAIASFETNHYKAKEYSRKLPNIFCDDDNRGYEFLWLWEPA
jgi:hypothetical protein